MIRAASIRSGRPDSPLLLAVFVLALVTLSDSVGAAGPAVRPGGIVRWAASDAVACAVEGRRWAPVAGVCYFPVDLETPPGELELGVSDGETLRTERVEVREYPYSVERITIEDESRVFLSKEDLARVRRERREIAGLWEGSEGPPRFRLPLAPPLETLPVGGRFGSRRIINQAPRSPHSGIDYTVGRETPVLSVAEGTVALVGDLFFSGKSVFVDHGGGLVSMYFHLSETAVEEGDPVERGQRVGAVGATGRATGPHLHFGVRWHGARVDPELLLDPEKAPEIGR
ncbi:MAG: M23 family metallopeptidase [Thermoanaerobaculia bacterium]|nr:M23 family metallopeptidase [Thermoanaerobaculia bacterium]